MKINQILQNHQRVNEAAPLKPGQLRARYSTNLLKQLDQMKSQVKQYQQDLDQHQSRLQTLQQRQESDFPLADYQHQELKLLPVRIQQLQQQLNQSQRQLNSFLEKYPPELLQRRQQQMQALAARMRQQCSDYLVHMSPRQTLYRGLRSGFPDQVFQGHSRLSRKPTDSDPAEIELFDTAAAQLGFKARRGNSIFCSGHIAQAQDYGSVFVIVPKNSADFTWSQTVSDMVLDKGDMQKFNLVTSDAELRHFISAVQQEDHLIDLGRRVKNSKDANQYQELLVAIRDQAWDGETDFSHHWTELTQLRSAAAQHLDLSAAPLGHWLKQSSQQLNFTPQLHLDRFQQHFALSSTDLDQAINSGHEVLVRGEYFAIALDIWKSELAPLLFGR